jgi:hypothetical protein
MGEENIKSEDKMFCPIMQSEIICTAEYCKVMSETAYKDCYDFLGIKE